MVILKLRKIQKFGKNKKKSTTKNPGMERNRQLWNYKNSEPGKKGKTGCPGIKKEKIKPGIK